MKLWKLQNYNYLGGGGGSFVLLVLFDLILYVPSTIFQLCILNPRPLRHGWSRMYCWPRI